MEDNIKHLINRLDPHVEIVMLTKFGSHLYGTDTSSSDTDYKGVFMPSKKMICLGTIPKSINNNRSKGIGEKNTAGDVDFELYSLQYFIHLASKGETAALDMLHTNEQSIIKSSTIWDYIHKRRHLFYTKNLRSFVQYARRQAAKYGIKGSRLNAAKDFLEYMSRFDKTDVMRILWDDLPVGEHSKYIETNQNGIKQYQVCGKIIQESVKVGYAYDIVNKYYCEFGKRAERAARNEGIDWKAISHALRAAYQVESILINGDIHFPLTQADFLRDVKQGKLDYLTQVGPVLETQMDKVERLSEKSTLPEKTDHSFWENYIQHVVTSYFINSMS